MSVLVSWVVMPCGLTDRYQHFRGTYYLPSSALKHGYESTRPHIVTFQKTSFDTVVVEINYSFFLYDKSYATVLTLHCREAYIIILFI
jgi:hypothetical protein